MWSCKNEDFFKLLYTDLSYKTTTTTTMTDCPICFETLDFGGNNCMRTECGHGFHTSCLMMSLHQSNDFKCPYCRQKMVGQAPARARAVPVYGAAREAANDAAMQVYCAHMDGVPAPNPIAARAAARVAAMQAYCANMDGVPVGDPTVAHHAADDAVVQALLSYHPELWEPPASRK